ncbi:gliding motility-associated C-terminal domain-containing protein [Hymenobacter lucidus]|uniref:Gliding motility-associated C-terminal domain-containing protein n=1 Tax=Hymenobacter lucidus TaxID=2880930 RepID=A0ABS8ALJ4_9BACT|nr:gliding motility-associated C-terminal domain-containing protein [Hymenobacter lucidus]MCB2406918.1 gliding motility-associated C-terminal domain-containing protein [Hymenobacter lucidus]
MWQKSLCLAALFSACPLSSYAQSVSTHLASLEFVENRGQWPAPVRYQADIPGGRLFLEPGGLTYSLLAGIPHHRPAANDKQSATGAVKAHSLRVSFAGGSLQPALKAETQTAEVRNYLRGNDPSGWASNVPGFREVRYADIWPGIGAHFYENQQQQLEYDFELAAEARPEAIVLRYNGADALALTAEGSLEVRTSVGVLRELAPQAWQTDANGKRRPIPCAYVLQGNVVSFRLGSYDQHRPLTIDPTVVFSSYTGSTADNWGFTATYDPEGNMYSGGIVYGAGYPTTVGAFSAAIGGLIDIGLIKYKTSANGPAARVWATYLGGTQADFPHSLVVGSRGELFLLGTTSSVDYPTSALAYDRTYNGGTGIDPFGYGPTNFLSGSDIVVTRLAADGSRLVGSTYLGGSGNDGMLPAGASPLLHNYGDGFRGDILLDADDNIYLASNTTSTNFPNVNGLGGTYRGGTHDAVVCKLDATASSLLWSSFVGGTGADAAYSLQLAANGSVYVSGGTTSPNFPATPDALHPTARGSVDGFVARLSSAGNVLQKATYLGTSLYDQAYFLQLDGSGAVYVLGQSAGSYPVTAGRYQNAGSKQFIHKLNADLTATEFSTVFGSSRGTIDISPTAFLVDQCNRIYLSGWGGGENNIFPFTNGTTFNMPTTANAVQRTTDGADFYLMQLAPDATRLDYATFFGQSGDFGDHVDGGTSRFDPRGFVYQAVCSCNYMGSGGFPVPPGANTYATRIGIAPGCNNAAFKFNFETVNVVAGNDQVVCVAAAAQPLAGSPAGGVWTGPGVSGSVATGFVFTPTQALLGLNTLTYTVTGTGPCGGVATLRLTVVTSPPPATFNASVPSSFCLGTTSVPTVPLSATPAGGTFSGPGVINNFFNPNVAGPGTHTLVYNVVTGGCILQASRTVTVIRASAGSSNLTTCSNAAPTALKGGLPAGGTWSGPGVSGSVAAGFVFTPTAALVGSRFITYTVTGAEGCTSTASLFVTVQQGNTFTPPVLPTYCTSTTTPTALPTGAIWSGPGVQSGFQSYTFTPYLAGAGTFLLNYRTGYGLCDATGTVSVTVAAPAPISTPADTLLCPGSTQPFRLRASPAGGVWSGPNVSSAGIFTPPANFTGSARLTYTVVNGPCTSTATRQVTVAAAPLYAATWTAELCAETRQAPLTVRFADPLNNFSGVRWDFGDGSQGTGNNTTHVYQQPGRYTPRIIRSYNNGLCSVQLSLPEIEVQPGHEIPNIITPNADYKNDYFVATNGCPARLQIFSRWGTKVYEAASYRNDWGGENLPNGVYYYRLEQTDGVIIKGWVEINR